MIGYNQRIQGGIIEVSIQCIQQAICYMEQHIYDNINYTETCMGYAAPLRTAKLISVMELVLL